MIEEQDLKMHQNYGEIETDIEEISRNQVCAFASRVRGNNGKRMHSILFITSHFFIPVVNSFIKKNNITNSFRVSPSSFLRYN
jgi:hypothetical protein